MNPSTLVFKKLVDLISIRSWVASTLPPINGTHISCPACLAADSIAEFPPNTIKSANDTFVPLFYEPLNVFWIYFSLDITFCTTSGSFIYQSFIGANAILAPFVPPL